MRSFHVIKVRPSAPGQVEIKGIRGFVLEMKTSFLFPITQDYIC